jgi:hypothetical protein
MNIVDTPGEGPRRVIYTRVKPLSSCEKKFIWNGPWWLSRSRWAIVTRPMTKRAPAKISCAGQSMSLAALLALTFEQMNSSRGLHKHTTTAGGGKLAIELRLHGESSATPWQSANLGLNYHLYRESADLRQKILPEPPSRRMEPAPRRASKLPSGPRQPVSKSPRPFRNLLLTDRNHIDGDGVELLVPRQIFSFRGSRTMTYAHALQQVLGLGIDVQLPALAVLGKVQCRNLRHILILSLPLLFLQFEGDATNGASLDALHPRWGQCSCRTTGRRESCKCVVNPAILLRSRLDAMMAISSQMRLLVSKSRVNLG